jgi:hypothetical protein
VPWILPAFSRATAIAPVVRWSSDNCSPTFSEADARMFAVPPADAGSIIGQLGASLWLLLDAPLS